MANNIDKERFINTIIASSGGKLGKSALENAAKGDMSELFSSLGEEDRQKLSAALSDKNKAKEMLSSSAAKELLAKLFGNG